MPEALPLLSFDQLPRDCWVTIATDQLTRNFKLLQQAADRPVLAVVKANGYGHGYVLAAQSFLKAGASYLGVASLSEGLWLRRHGITAPILIICGMLPPEMALAAEAGLEFFVWRKDHLDALRQIAAAHAPVRAHLKVNTGMGRLGCWPAEAPALAAEFKAISGVELTGLATHFATAYNPTLPDTDRQIDRFDQVIAALAAINIRPQIIHAANSSAALYYPRGRYDMVRIGISLYGVPGEMIALPQGVATALTWHARLTSTNLLPKGHGVSYAGEYVMPEDGRVGVLPVGYADGFQRVPKNVNTVLVAGRERKVIGRICMDQCMIDLSGFDDITGAEVVLIGEQGACRIDVRDVARRWGTNAYDVMCGIAARVPRRAL